MDRDRGAQRKVLGPEKVTKPHRVGDTRRKKCRLKKTTNTGRIQNIRQRNKYTRKVKC